MDWHGFWFGASHLPWYMIALRTIIIYLAITIATGLMHFRHVGGMARHNYLVAAGIVGVAGVRILSPDTSLVMGLATIAVLTSIGIFLSYLDLKVPRIMSSKPVALIAHGRMQKNNLRKSNLTIENLLGQLRLQGVFNLADVENAYLEGTGKVSVIKKMEAQPAYRQQLNLPEKLACPPTQLIYDGAVIEENLQRLALDQSWLAIELQKQGFSTPQKVFFAALLPDGTLYACSH
ncbi:DUF421 domain-containing protein [Peptococcaceae bacterium 1198_IL3148]